MKFDDAGVAALIADLDHADKPVLRRAVDALIALAGDSPQIHDSLHRRLAEAGHRNYWPVAYILAHLPDASAAVLEVLVQALDHPEPDIRWAVSLLLARIGEKNPGLLIRLIGLCASGTSNQKRMALYCLRDLALTDGSSAAAMTAALSDRDAGVRVAAAICLKTRPDLHAGGRSALLNAYLNDEQLKVRHAAAIALASLGEPSPEFLAALENNSRLGEDQVRKAADAALELLEKRRPASDGGASSR